MSLDRELQRKILYELREAYPNDKSVQLMSCFQEGATFNKNLFYLHEHGLISGKIQHDRTIENQGKYITFAEITADGMDFLEDDGGLGAILNKVVVTFDRNDLDLIIRAIDSTNVPAEDKQTLKSTLKSLPGEGLKAVYIRLIEAGLGKTTDVLQLIKKCIDP
ncbi:MAG: hypothetical protein KQH59_18620 [Desulfobulbaceae bacterium]|nr:hypothetical protein [Desulfobulbaceae bacterium]